ncbi:uncharacterized protein YfcZ (UPF0381/DUF406 family) [Microbacterium paludicola]|uniref:Uncharacterized protein YfcZ (UPF0381/DUF406 family) n=1 Tax=Microbacterium paludicola TaxID=300019 RepID=A0ABU1HYR4_9MICO|nr:DUF4041 domain-containing protein [Microbacterium paludicola]MDR6166783.1 uncharacterized protein YfcZ (UPF0381/DUF406 family) [Microbacterium paludicola]
MTDRTSPPPASWYPDPGGVYESRYWDGATWTDHIVIDGVQTRAQVRETPDRAATTPGQPTTRRAARESTVSESVSGDMPAAGGQVGAPLLDEAAPAIAQQPSAPLAPQELSPARPTLPQKVPFFGARKFAQDLQAENARLEELIARYGLRELADLDAAKVSIQAETTRAEADLDRARSGAFAAHQEKASVAAQVIDLRNQIELQEFGLFDFEHPAESSVALATELESVRSEIKSKIKAGGATQATQNFTFNNSAAKGRKFVADMSKLLLRAYNAEAENCVKTVRAGNLEAARKRLSTVVDQVERLGKMIDLRITPRYHRLRLRELELASRHLQAVQAEKELERARREELREQKKAEQELAREKERLQKERSHYANALATLEAKGDLEGAQRIREKLDDVENAIENVDYRAANIRAGYVYVISNIGAFGPDVVKIGLTRRLDPMDRVNELGDASVPFRFDVHALFFADDAVAIESMLHQQFAEQRLNKVNLRREYFRVTPEDVLKALNEHHVEVLEYTLDPVAAEYRSSIAVA